MLQWLPTPILGAVTSLILLINLLVWMVPVYALILVKLFVRGAARDRVSRWIASAAQQWAAINVWVWRRLVDIDWQIRGVSDLDREGQYLVIANHQSWVDIPMLMAAFDRRAPFFKFFIKQELIWVPILGLVWWGLDFPFMKRYSAAQIAKNPSLRGKDLETTKRACEKYRNQPVTILNFLEGTRFTAAKHQRQASPYPQLLRPRAGGFAFALSALGPRLDAMLDVTIVYPDGAPKGLWQLMSGQMRRVIIEVKQIRIPTPLFEGDYAGDPGFRGELKKWVDALWQEKNARIEELKQESGAAG
ncbi:MAG: acyltransferase [Salinisphaeraceae bacterium]